MAYGTPVTWTNFGGLVRIFSNSSVRASVRRAMKCSVPPGSCHRTSGPSTTWFAHIGPMLDFRHSALSQILMAQCLEMRVALRVESFQLPRGGLAQSIGSDEWQRDRGIRVA